MTNKEKIKSLVQSMITESTLSMNKKIDKVLNSGAIDIETWNENNNSMIVPKAILIALLQNEAGQYSAKGTSFEKVINKEVKNLSHFI